MTEISMAFVKIHVLNISRVDVYARQRYCRLYHSRSIIDAVVNCLTGS